MHRRTALLALCLLFAAASASASGGVAAQPTRWAIELGPGDVQFARANLARLRADGLTTVVVDTKRVSPSRRAALAKAARAARMSFVAGSATCRAAHGCWRIVASPAAGRTARTKGHARLIMRLREPSTIGALRGVAPRMIALVRVDPRSFAPSDWEAAVSDAQKLPGVELGLSSTTTATSRSVELFRAARRASDSEPPSAPASVVQTASSPDSVTVAWQPAVDNVAVDRYELFRNGAAAGTTKGTKHTLSQLACGSAYTFGVVARDRAGNRSPMSAIGIATAPCALPALDLVPPTPPSNFRKTSSTTTSITVAWTASVDAVGVAGYRLFRSGAEVGTAPGTTYTYQGLGCGQGYTLHVEAYDAAGNRSVRMELLASTRG